MNVLFLMKNTGMSERLGLMGLSALLKRDGHDTKLVVAESLSDEEILREVASYEPDVLAYSIMTGEHRYHMELNQMVRSSGIDCFSVFGGPHPTYEPNMVQYPFVDAICRGEADVCFPDLVNRLDRGQGYFDVSNFWFKGPDGEIGDVPLTVEI